jgi:hypothetical protein
MLLRWHYKVARENRHTEETARKTKNFMVCFFLLRAMPSQEASENFCLFCLFHLSAIFSIIVDITFKKISYLQEVTRL